MSGQKDSIIAYMVQSSGGDEFDSSTLRRKLFPVNVRLLKSSPEYKMIIASVIQYMRRLLNVEFSDYPRIKGISGANVGIPFNVIGVREIKGERGPVFMINPKITKKSRRKNTVSSNCGSVLLDEPVELERHESIEMSYYTIDGDKIEGESYWGCEGYTIQHEVEHNLGILVTDHKELEKNQDEFGRDDGE